MTNVYVVKNYYCCKQNVEIMPPFKLNHDEYAFEICLYIFFNFLW